MADEKHHHQHGHHGHHQHHPLEEDSVVKDVILRDPPPQLIDELAREASSRDDQFLGLEKDETSERETS